MRKRQPERMCVICRQRFPKGQLNRLLLNGEGKLVLDPQAKREGRACYICDQAACHLQAERRGIRLGQGQLCLPSAELMAEVRRAASRRHPDVAVSGVSDAACASAEALRKIESFLGLARRMGALAVGMDAVQSAWREGQKVWLANSISSSSLKRIGRLVSEGSLEVLPFDKAALGAALGRSETALVLVTDPNVQIEIERWLRVWRSQV